MAGGRHRTSAATGRPRPRPAGLAEPRLARPRLAGLICACCAVVLVACSDGGDSGRAGGADSTGAQGTGGRNRTDVAAGGADAPAAGAPSATVAELPGAANATVVRGVDGDTIVVRSGGVDEKVRFLGIDTPETVKPDTPVECFGKEASDRMKALLPEGTPVVLERDREARDRYGRLLAYVYRANDRLFVNLAMVTEGYAQPAPVKPNTAHDPEIEAAGRAARQANLGLWGTCGGDDKFG